MSRGPARPGRRDAFVVGLALAVVTAWPTAGAAAAQEAGEGRGATLAVVGGRLIDGNEGPALQNSVVLVSGSRITRVGTVDDTEIPAGVEVVDADGYTVMPGLSDAHVHTMIVGHGVYDAYFPAYRDRFREIMPISARELLMSGVTSARDLGAPLRDALWLRDEIEAGRLAGPRLFVSGPFLQATLPAGAGASYDSRVQSSFRWAVDGPEDARAKARRLVDAGVDVLKVIQLDRLTAGERSAIADVGREAGLPIAVHAYSVEEVRMAAEMGAASIEHVGAGRKPRYPDETVRLMADHGIYAVPTSVVDRVLDLTLAFPERLDAPRLRRDLPEDLYRDVRASLRFFTRLDYFEGDIDDGRNGAEKIPQLFEGGVPLAVGTDSGTPMNFHYESTWREMALLVEYGIPPMKVLTMATREPARLYGVGDDLGTVEPGKLADIIVVDGDPLTDMGSLSPNRVVHVIRDGEVVR